MARTDAIVLGGGIVGVSVALQLAKRGMSVALVERAGVGEQTSYGNSGVIEGSTILPPAFPASLGALLRVAFKRASEANYHLSFPAAASRPGCSPSAPPRGRIASPRPRGSNRPLFARALAEHETLMAEAGALRYLRKTGWMKIYRSERAFAALAPEFELAREFGIAAAAARCARRARARALAPSGVRARGVLAAGGEPLRSAGGDARLCRALCRARRRHRCRRRALAASQRATAGGWRPMKAASMRPRRWSRSDHGRRMCSTPLGLKLPMAVKRGYHRHFRGQGNAALSRPVVDTQYGYLITPMEQGIRLTTGAEFAARDAQPTPVQFDRLMPQARALFPLGERADDKTWLGARPCFPDSRPVIGRAPGLPGLWLAIGHAHWGLTLGPVTGLLIGRADGGRGAVLRPGALRRGALLARRRYGPV